MVHLKTSASTLLFCSNKTITPAHILGETLFSQNKSILNNQRFLVTFSQKSKKCISPVVATILLLIVAIVSIVGFQSWFETYQNGMLSDVEIQSNSAISDTLKIDSIVGNILYIVNNLQYNLSISQLKIDGNICTITNNLTLGMNQILISSCINNLSTSTPDVVLITEKKIISKKVFIKNVVSTKSSSLSCPAGYILIPGSGTYLTSDFCVMKYEAKNVGGIANSTASGTIWISQTLQQAKINCNNLGIGYHLITENEWLTIAKNVEQVTSNWNSSVVGSGFIFSGHNDNGPITALLADTNDSNGYFGTNDNLTNCDGFNNNYPNDNIGSRACAGQRRTFTISNGEIIWDLSGNVWEFVNSSMAIASRYHGGNQTWMSYNSDDGTGKIASLVPALKVPSSGWNADNGMGRYYDGFNLLGAYNSINESPDNCGPGYCSPIAVFIRGGALAEGAGAGIFALGLNGGNSYASTYVGFRCSYTPLI